jgi:hypothetical protein
MPKIKIDEIEYNTEDLSANGILQLRSLQFVESQLEKTKNEIFAYQSAKQAYVNELKIEIKKSKIKPIIP